MTAYAARDSESIHYWNLRIGPFRSGGDNCASEVYLLWA